MMPTPAWLRAKSDLFDRLGTPLGFLGVILALSFGAALLITLSPLAGLLLAATFVALFITEYVLPPGWATTAPILVLFLTPADEIVGLSEDRRGFFMLALGSLLFLTTLVRGRIHPQRRAQFLLPGLATMYIAVHLIHASKGELRDILFWVAAIGVWIWLDGRITADTGVPRRTIENALILVSAISGAIGLLEYLGIAEPSLWIPGYEPYQDTFTSIIGRRAVGLSGHALRYGTLCMIGCAIGGVRLALGADRRRSPWLAASVIAAGAGLIVSGARGSWLALLCGLGFALAATIKSRRVSGDFVIRGSVVAVAIVGLVMASGLGFLVRERLTGTATAPASIGQRVVAFQTIVDSLPDLPFLGVGSGGAAGFLLRGGAIVPNIENEYLIALVTGGPLAFITLLVCCGLTLRIAFRDAVASRESGHLAAWVAMCVNIATFNLFSWSAGPPLFAALMALVVLTSGRSTPPTAGP